MVRNLFNKMIRKYTTKMIFKRKCKCDSTLNVDSFVAGCWLRASSQIQTLLSVLLIAYSWLWETHIAAVAGTVPVCWMCKLNYENSDRSWWHTHRERERRIAQHITYTWHEHWTSNEHCKYMPYENRERGREKNIWEWTIAVSWA